MHGTLALGAGVGGVGLHFICLWSPWDMSALVLIPWVRAAMPRQTLVQIINSRLLSKFGNNCWVTKITAFLLLGVSSLIGALIYMN